jgi:hypothetical protein
VESILCPYYDPNFSIVPLSSPLPTMTSIESGILLDIAFTNAFTKVTGSLIGCSLPTNKITFLFSNPSLNFKASRLSVGA